MSTTGKGRRRVAAAAEVEAPVKTVTTRARKTTATAPETPEQRAAARDSALHRAAGIKSPDAALKALQEAASLRYDKAPSGKERPTVGNWKATAHQPVDDGTLRCYGACGRVLPVERFYRGADQRRREVECREDVRDRRGVNAQRRAAGLEPIPTPRVPDDQLPS